MTIFGQMKYFISLLLLSLSFVLKAQHIVFDKKDPFTNERQLVTSNFNLNSILEVGAMAHIGDTSKVFFLSFITPGVPGAKIETSDSVVKECKLKALDGKIISGKYFANAQVPIGFKLYNSYTYTFSEVDFKILAISEITNIKTDQGLFEVSARNKDKISKLCSFILSQ